MATVQVIVARDVQSIAVLGGPTPGYPDVVEQSKEAEHIQIEGWLEEDAYHRAGYLVDELDELEAYTWE